MNKQPIGVFDSGVGGLTVAKEIFNLLPQENVIYLGDTARVPYGTRDNKTINEFSEDLVKFLLKKEVKALVIACNTMSAISYDVIKKLADDIPVVDVIAPTVEHAIDATESNAIGVIGTRATINSNEYVNQIKSKANNIDILQTACPLFVPLVEEGFVGKESTKLIAKSYLEEINKSNIDALILGCTHYPMLKDVLNEVTGDSVKIIDSAFPTAEKLKFVLKEKDLLNLDNKDPRHEFYVTDNATRSKEIADLFFSGKFPGKIERINI